MSIEPGQLQRCDETGRLVGTCAKAEAHEPGAPLLHRAVSVIAVDGTGKVLVQRRADGKYHFAGRWSNACCTHPRPDETPTDAARRALRHELTAIPVDLSPAGSFLYRARDAASGLVEHEYDDVFVVRLRRDGLAPNPEEVADVAWLDPVPLASLLADHAAVTPWAGPALAVAARSGFPELFPAGAPNPLGHPELLELHWPAASGFSS